jgi:hypothetical protein
MNRHRFLRLVVFLLIAAMPLMAQEQTGSIEGTVKDSSGSALPGVTVEATSPGSGALQSITDSKGLYRFPRLQPGRYTVSASLPGLKTATKNNIDITLGRAAVVDLSMGLSEVAETITVTAGTPMVDVTTSGATASIAREQIDLIPKGRDFSSVVTQAPGVSREPFLQGLSIDGASGAENHFVLDGIDTTNPYNGVNGQNAATGANGNTGGQGIITDFIEEIQVKTAGYAAEFGGSVGGVINVITKSGTNAFDGSVLGYYSDSSWNGSPRPTYYESSPTKYVEFPRDDVTQFEPGAMIGGPIVRDRMWFFVGYNPTLISGSREPHTVTNGQLGASGGSFGQDQTIDYLTANVKGNIGSRFVYKLGGSSTKQEIEGVLPSQDNTTPTGTNLGITTEIPTDSYSAYADFLPSTNFYMTGRVGYYTTDYQTSGITDLARISFTGSNAATTAFPIGLPAGSSLIRPAGFVSLPTASFNEVAVDKWDRNAGGLDFNYFADVLGRHSLKAGVQFEKIKNEVSSGEFGNLITFRWNASDNRSLGVRGTYGAVGVRHFRTEGGADSDNTGIYLQDSWQPIPTLTLNLGVRAEEENVPYYGHTIDPTLPEWLIQWSYQDKIAPRLGFAWDAMSNQKLKVYGSYGTYYDIMKIDMSRQSGGAAKWIDYWYPLETLDWTSIAAKCSISNNDQSVNPCPTLGPNRSTNLRKPTDPSSGFDPDIKPMEQREFQLGADYQLTPVSVASVRYVNKKLINTIEDIGYLVECGTGCLEETFITGNPGKGIVAGDPAGPIPAQPTAKRDYEAIEFTYNRFFHNNFSVRASYTYSELTGNYSGLASSDEFGRNDPNIERYFDALWNAFDQTGDEVVGVLSTDRPHAVKAQVLYRAPFRSQFGVNTSWRSGTPISEEITFAGVPFFPNGRGNLGRTDNLTQTDLLITHPLALGARYNVEFSVNVLNLFDEDAVTQVGNTHYRGDLCDAMVVGSGTCNKADGGNAAFFGAGFDANKIMQDAMTRSTQPGQFNEGISVSPSYLQALSFQGPRSIRLGVKLTF